MSAREAVVLGIGSQVPTRERAHHSLAILLDGMGFIVDPGEGCQRQMTLAGLRATQINSVLITHFHGDHCLGFPGVIQRTSMDGNVGPLDVAFPASGLPYYERLRHASIFPDLTETRTHLVAEDGPVFRLGRWTVSAMALDHRCDCVGWRLVEDDGQRVNGDELARLGVRGRDVGTLMAEGEVQGASGLVRLADVAIHQPGQVVAVVMDTRVCDAAFELARGADLLVCESTFADEDAGLAADYGHLTAGQAGRIAAEAGARRLVLTHFSQRYRELEVMREQASKYHSDVVLGAEGLRVAVPGRPAIKLRRDLSERITDKA